MGKNGGKSCPKQDETRKKKKTDRESWLGMRTTNNENPDVLEAFEIEERLESSRNHSLITVISFVFYKQKKEKKK